MKKLFILLPLALTLTSCGTLPDRSCQIAKALACPPATEQRSTLELFEGDDHG